MAHVWLGGVIGMLGVLGGWAFTGKYHGATAAAGYLYAGSALMLMAIVGLLLLHKRAAQHAVAALQFHALLIQAALMPLLLGIAIPFLVTHDRASQAGWVVAAYFLLISAYQMWGARKSVERRWERVGIRALRRCYRADSHTIVLTTLADRMRLSVRLYLPPSLENVGWAFLSVAFFAGLFIQPLMPQWSAYLVGIPVLSIAAVWLQVSALFFFLSCKVRGLEVEHGGPIRIIDARHGRRIRKIKRLDAL